MICHYHSPINLGAKYNDAKVSKIIYRSNFGNGDFFEFWNGRITPTIAMKCSIHIAAITALAFLWILPSLGLTEEIGTLHISENVLEKNLINVDRRIDIRPNKPKNGIVNGFIIAYGHRIKPPYLLEYKEDKLFVNGVQVKPSYIDERENAKQIPLNDYETIKVIASTADKVVTKIQGMARAGASKQEIFNFARHQDHIEDVHFESENYMMITIGYNGRHWPWGIELPRPQPIIAAFPKANQIGNKNTAEQRELSWLRNSLKKGMCLIFLSDGGISQRPVTLIFPNNIKVIMDDQSIDQQEKFLRLKTEVFSGVSIAALDVLANYSKAEWSQ